MRISLGLLSNWAMMAVPKVSAVMPVPSEMTKIVWVCMVRAVIRWDLCKQCHVPDSESGLSHATLAGSAYNGAHYSQIQAHAR
ncbi:hypothetical protein Cthiooxydans_11900 [Comamonas thiooxydans]|nr:hypothetical protein Cthiooxydans_11900 [Comamonas thiooxydans]